MQFARINDSKLDAINNLAFLNWAITDTPNIVWISNNSFLVNVVHVNAYWQENGSYNENYQRLKITIL